MRTLLFNHSSEKVQTFPFLAGNIAIYSHKASDKEGPNEDALACLSIGDSYGILAIADGVGGAPQGDIAAQIAMESLARKPKDTIIEFSDLRNFVIESIERANQRILALATGASTTIAVVAVNYTVVQTFHVGDSPIMVMGQRGRIRLASISHSPTGYADAAGMTMYEDDPEWFVQNRSLICNYVGSRDMRIEIGPKITLNKNDTVLIASDGLSDNITQEDVVQLARKGPLKPTCELLAKTCQHAMQNGSELGGHIDDLSFILFRPK